MFMTALSFAPALGAATVMFGAMFFKPTTATAKRKAAIFS